MQSLLMQTAKVVGTDQVLRLISAISSHVHLFITSMSCCGSYIFQHGRCRSVTEFEKQSRVGEGTYGIVCKLCSPGY